MGRIFDGSARVKYKTRAIILQMKNELFMANKLRICDKTQAATLRSKFYCRV